MAADRGQSSIELHVGRDGRASEWTHYLPPASQAMEQFREPVSIVIRGPVIPGPPPEDSDRAMKVFVGGTPTWQDSQTLIDTFGQLWADILQVLTDVSGKTVQSVYFAGPATHGRLFSFWPCLPSGLTNDRRFFVAEMCKDSQARTSPWGRVCVEYAYEDFKQLAGSEGFDFPYGTYVMGMSIAESKVAAYLRNDVFDKNVLERALKDGDLRCWWFCDSDFEGMTIWHKDHSGDDLSKRLREVIDKQAV